jgi:endonuclease/exonuclease/phosphatase family metal-dependent hydrolase
MNAVLSRFIKIGALGLILCVLTSASLDLVRASPNLCRDDRPCPELGKKLDVRWTEIRSAIDAVGQRQVDAQDHVRIAQAPAGARTLTVMVYNIKGLPDALRGGANPDAFTIIGKTLAARRRAGTAPDVVLIQEAFTHRSREIATLAGYRNVVRGPLRPGADTVWLARPFLYLWRAAWNRSVHLESSGLMILTDLDIDGVKPVAFGHRACAGSDCFANKGLLYARVRLPDSGIWVDIIDTHLNSNASSGAGITSILFAHERQVDRIGDILTAKMGDGDAMILGGDFNSNPETIRYAYLRARLDMQDANTDCLLAQTGCDIPRGVDLLNFWRGNELREFYRQGHGITVRPIRATLDFVAPVDGRPLSDHDAVEITYLVRSTGQSL